MTPSSLDTMYRRPPTGVSPPGGGQPLSRIATFLGSRCCADPRRLSRKPPRLRRDISMPRGLGLAVNGVQGSHFRYVVTLQVCLRLVMVYC